MPKTIEARIYWNIHKKSGYNQCNLIVDGKKYRCNGGGYDMLGTCFGSWIADNFAELLREKIKTQFYGLSFYNPNHDPGKTIVPDTGKTVEELEAEGKSLGLERYQAAHAATSPVPTELHTQPHLDGATGIECMLRVFRFIGGEVKWVRRRPNDGAVYQVTLPENAAVPV